ncbi:glycosyltransferase [Corynebacterium sp. HMSC055A01]|uniref:glycosyltransferase n=1 Tax=Corynebacterium sp. HMSC055A01 TaxID=1715083 RepID=UPI0009F328AE|nr:glycosyltransferase [Corynebacterium sp. HMSC055A01]
MIKRLLHFLVSCSMLSEALWQMIHDDPRNFLFKVSERIRMSSLGKMIPAVVPKLSRLVEGSGQIDRLFREGALTELISLGQGPHASEFARSDRRKILRASERWELLHRDVKASIKSLGRSALGGEIRDTRVAFFLTNSVPYTQSGYTFRSHEMAKALREIGQSVSMMTRFAYPLVVGRFPKSSAEEIEGISYYRQLAANYPPSLLDRHRKSVQLLVDLLRELRVEVVHTTTDFNNALVVAEAANVVGIPWVYEIRGELEKTWLSRHPQDLQAELKESDFYKAAREQEEQCMKAAGAVIVLSEVSRKQLVARGIEPSKIRVIPNAVESKFVGLKHDRNELRTELGINGEIVVGTVTSVVGYEGLDTLLRASAHLPKVTVLIVGDGSERPALETLADELNIANRVIFAGRQSNDSIWKWYGALDAFVVPRRNTEVCRTVTPIKPLMAQALGIEVICSDLPALREITGNFGTYVAPECPEELAIALSEVERDMPRNSEAIRWAAEHTWLANALRVRELYDELLR